MTDRKEALNELLHAAVKARSLDAVEVALREGADINSKDKNGMTVLHEAAAKGYLIIVGFLIEANANVKAITKEGETAADLARKNGFEAIAIILEPSQ